MFATFWPFYVWCLLKDCWCCIIHQSRFAYSLMVLLLTSPCFFALYFPSAVCVWILLFTFLTLLYTVILSVLLSNPLSLSINLMFFCNVFSPFPNPNQLFLSSFSWSPYTRPWAVATSRWRRRWENWLIRRRASHTGRLRSRRSSSGVWMLRPAAALYYTNMHTHSSILCSVLSQMHAHVLLDIHPPTFWLGLCNLLWCLDERVFAELWNSTDL